MSSEDRGVVAVQKWMGMRPFIFIELTGIDEDENISCDIEFGGGLTEADLRDTLETVLAFIPEVPS